MEVSTMYCSIIGDIKDSKKIKDRYKIQEKFISILHYVNKKYRKDIESEFKIVQGDEFQGLLNNTQNLLEIIQNIELELLPAKIRIGIGIGDVKTDIYKNNISNIDGQAFYNARDAIEAISISEGKYENIIQSINIKVDDKLLTKKLVKGYIEILNVGLMSCTLINRDWTEKQIEVINLKRKNLTQREIAEKINKTQSAVQKRLSSSGYYTYSYCIKKIQNNFNIIWEVLNDE